MVGLEFVSISHPDDIKKRELRRRIGQHVMKNIGYGRRKRRGHQAVEITQPRQSPEEKKEAEKAYLSIAANSNSQLTEGVERHFEKSPITSRSRNYAARAARLQNPLLRDNSPMCKTQRQLYYTLAMIEDGAFQLAMADAALFEIGKPVGRFKVVQENPWAMKHYTACIAAVNSQLREGQALSQSLMGTIIGLAAYDLTIRNFERWTTHMKGLEGVIRARGGYESLNSRYVITTLLWTDMCGSLNMDAPPNFPPVEGVYANGTGDQGEKHSLPMILQGNTRGLRNRGSRFSKLATLLESFADLAASATAIPSAAWVDDEALVDKICTNAHFALNLPRCKGPHGLLLEDEIQYEAIRIACLLFVVGLVLRLSGEKDMLLDRVGRLPTLLKNKAINWKGLEELELWVYVLAARIEEGDDRQWLVVRICSKLKARKMSVMALKQKLRDISWVDEAMGEEMSDLEAEVKARLSK